MNYQKSQYERSDSMRKWQKILCIIAIIATTIAATHSLKNDCCLCDVFGGIGGNSTQQTDPPPVSDEATDNGRDYVVNKNTKKFHYPSCSSADDIKASNRWDYHGTREELINMGYVPCKRCHP